MLKHEISYDSVRRFLGVLIIDDSIAEKPHTDVNDIICWHYDHHTQGRTIKDINFVTCLYHSQGVSLPVTNHFFAALCGYIKLELLKCDTKLNHFALKSKLYLHAIHFMPNYVNSTLSAWQPKVSD